MKAQKKGSRKPEARSENGISDRRKRSDYGFWLLASGFLFWLLLVPGITAPQQRYTLDQVLAKMDEVGKSFRSMQANMERTKVTVLVNDKYLDSGNVYFARRGAESRIKIDILKPEQQHVLIDMGKALLFFPKLKQVQEYFLGKNQDKAEFLLIGFGQSNQKIKEFYDSAVVGEETIDGKNTTILELKPKSAQVKAMYRNIRLWLDQERWIPIQSKLTEASGDYMIVRFTNIKTNVNIPDSIFELKMPKDVQVIKM